jgi:predicted small lipoprotein YifL
MRRIVLSIVLTFCAVALAACGLADSRTPLPLPDFMRAKQNETLPLEPTPDVRRMVREKLDSVFTAQSNPQHVQVSEARHELRGLGWTACVKAELTSASGKPLGQETYRISIDSGVIIDRRRAMPEDGCDIQTFQPI